MRAVVTLQGRVAIHSGMTMSNLDLLATFLDFSLAFLLYISVKLLSKCRSLEYLVTLDLHFLLLQLMLKRRLLDHELRILFLKLKLLSVSK